MFQVIPPACDSDMSTTQVVPSPASPSIEIKEVLLAPEVYGGSTEVEQCPLNKLHEPLTSNELASELNMEERKQVALETVEESNKMEVDVVVIVDNISKDSGINTLDMLEGSETKINRFEPLDGIKAASVTISEGKQRPFKESVNSTPEIQMQCKISESEEFGESAELTDVTDVKEDEMTCAEVEDKSMLVGLNNQPMAATSANFQVATPGLGEGQSTRPMVKRVMSKMDGKFYKRERGHRSSQRLHPETMTKTLDSYSKSLKIRKAAKVIKRNYVAGTRTKRHHAEMESTDSGSSEGRSLFGYSKRAFNVAVV